MKTHSLPHTRAVREPQQPKAIALSVNNVQRHFVLGLGLVLVAAGLLLTLVFVSLRFAPTVHAAPAEATALAQAAAARPLGVTLFALGNALVGGCVPLFNAAQWLARRQWREQGGGGWMVVFGGIGCGVLVAAAGAWLGNNQARLALLALVGVIYSVAIVANLALLGVPAERRPRFSFPSFMLAYAVSWLGVNLWYFLQPHVVAWYTN